MGKCQSCGSENFDGAESCSNCGSTMHKEMACPDCGISNWADSKACRICGAKLDGTHSTPRAMPSERPGFRPKIAICPRCGSRYDSHLVGCPACQPGAFVESSSGRGSIVVPMTAGILLLIAGVVNILTAVVFMSYLGGISVELDYCGAILAIMGIVALPAWVFCMQRTHFGYCIAAAAITLFSIGPFFFSSLLGLIALILIAVSHREFR